MSKIVITGVTGMTGSHMVDYLLKNTDHEIYGMIRRVSNPNYSNILDAMGHPRFHFVTGDLSDGQSIENIINEIKPDYFINFAAQSHVHTSWVVPEQTFDTTCNALIRILESIRKFAPNCRVYSSGSSEQFGDVEYSPQDEKHPFKPRSPYGAAKCAAGLICKVYKESYDLYIVHGICFNHESYRRGEQFVTRKITKTLCKIKWCLDRKLSFDSLKLGNIDSKRDWSYAPDFVVAIWRMLNQEIYNKNYKNIRDYVVASGKTYSVRDFIIKSLDCLGLSYSIKGKGLEEKFIHKGQAIIEIDKNFYRPAEVDLLLGDSSLIRKELEWEPEYNFDELVREMINHDKK